MKQQNSIDLEQKIKAANDALQQAVVLAIARKKKLGVVRLLTVIISLMKFQPMTYPMI